MSINLEEFAITIRDAIFCVCEEFRGLQPKGSPYAFTIIKGQCGNYLGYAIATEEGLRQVAADYEGRGYRYQGEEWEKFDNREKLSIWLRWANPDDGWAYGDFPESHELLKRLDSAVKGGFFGENAEGLEEFCVEVLTSVHSDPRWHNQFGDRVVLGLTSGEDPRDFLRTATRANPYPLVGRLWQEYCAGEELSSRIGPT